MAENDKQSKSEDGPREEYTVSGGELLDKVKEVIKEGNARRIIASL